MALKEVGIGLSPKEREILKELQDKVAALAALANDLKAKYNAAVTLLNELKADHNAHLAAANMHYTGTASTTDTVNTTASADATQCTISDVTI